MQIQCAMGGADVRRVRVLFRERADRVPAPGPQPPGRDGRHSRDEVGEFVDARRRPGPSWEQPSFSSVPSPRAAQPAR